jgi:hypothetical protein
MYCQGEVLKEILQRMVPSIPEDWKCEVRRQGERPNDRPLVFYANFARVHALVEADHVGAKASYCSIKYLLLKVEPEEAAQVVMVPRDPERPGTGVIGQDSNTTIKGEDWLGNHYDHNNRVCGTHSEETKAITNLSSKRLTRVSWKDLTASMAI